MKWRPNLEQRHGCQFHRDNPEPKPEECFCPSCDGEHTRWDPVIECYGYARYIVYLEDGTVVRACSPDAHGHSVVWSGELYLNPYKQNPLLVHFDTMLKEIWSSEYLETRIRSMGWLDTLHPMKYGTIIIDDV